MPAQGERGKSRGVDGLLRTVEYDVFVDHVSRLVARIGDLNMVPRVDLPFTGVASGLGMYPDGLVVLGSAGVLGVVPRIGVTIALDAINDAMPVTQDLVHVQFDV